MVKKLLFSVLSWLLSMMAFGQPNAISTSEFISIGGIDQWVTIKMTDPSKPAVLFLHGGPGSSLSPYADAVFEGWEKDLILVQWDQRGTGKTFGTYAPKELDPEFLKSHPLTVEQMVEDGIELTEHLLIRLGKQKLILFGTSWGSVLGAKMATERPDLFHAYIGHSQIVDPEKDNKYTYTKLLKLVKDNNDKESLQLLDSLGAPPYNKAKDTGRFIRVIKKYERMNCNPFPEEWGIMASGYDSAEDSRHRADGDDYSFLSYAGDKRFAIEPMSATIHLLEDNYRFDIPVYLIQGEEDILTPPEITRDYFEKIEAPEKKWTLLPEAAHGFDPMVIAALYQILIKNIVPEITD